jgi:hypothetical protein
MPITVDAGVENEAESKQREALREAGRKGARRSGEARRQKAERTDHEKTHETLVESLQSPSAIARIQAAKELLARKPADPEPGRQNPTEELRPHSPAVARCACEEARRRVIEEICTTGG